MSIRYLDQNGAVSFWTNIKNFILSKIPTKTSELTNDSGYLTSHQSLSNYVTLNSEQTITGKKLFTNVTTKVNSVNTFTGSTQFIDLSTSVPRGEFPESAHRVGRVYIGDNTSYNGSWFIIDPTIDTDKAYYRMVTTNPDNTDSTRFSITWDSTKEGARRRRNVSMGDLICATNNAYQIGESGNVWKDAYINNIHGISDYTNFLTSVLNANTTLTHAVHGRRTVLAMGSITLTVPTPEEGSWFLIKAVNGLVTLNLANNVTVTGITAGVFSGPIHLQPNESVLLCYYSSAIYNATISTIRRSGIVGRTGNVPSENPKHWFKIAENYVTGNYRDPFICLRVFESTTGNTIGTLCAHCRINTTIGVVDTSNCYLQWQDAGAGIDLSKYALTTNETSGTGVTITLWCMLTGGYSSIKFEVVSEYGQSDQLDNPEWVLTRRRQADGDLAELSDTDFTKIVYSTLTTLKNDTTGKANNVTGTVAIANGGTGATTRLSAVKALTNESVGTPTHFLAITTNWGKAGYTTVAQAKTVLGITGDMGSHSDSEYVHKTGNETISGDKTFANRPIIYNASASSQSDVPYIWLKNGFMERGSTTNVGEQGIKFVDKNANNISSIVSKNNASSSGTVLGCTDLELTSYNTDGTNTKTTGVVIRRGTSDSKVFPYADDTTDLGATNRRWSNVYATNYYYGSSNTSFEDKFVTTDTNQTISSVKTFDGVDIKLKSAVGDYGTVGGGLSVVYSDKNSVQLAQIKLGNYTSGTSYNKFTINAYDSNNQLIERTLTYSSSSTSLATTYFRPDNDNIVSLGTTGNRWSKVYATNYYYGSDNTEFSTKFVTSDTTQTISGSKTFTSTITGNISGNASTATEFSTNKDVTLTGDVTGTASSKAGWSVSTTLSNSGVTAGTYGPSEDVTGNNNATISVPEITVDSKGRVTSVTNRTLTCKNNTYSVYNKTLTIQKNGTNVATFTSNSNTNVTANITVPTKTSELTNDSNFLTTSSSLNASKLTGTIDIARLPQGALERVITVADQTARFALTTSSVQLGDTVKQLDTGVMYVVVDESKLNSNDGYLEYTAGSASSVPWSGITSKPTEFTPSSHTHTKSEITDFPTNVSAFTNDSGYLTSHQSLSNYVTLNTAQEITNAKTFKDANTVRKLTSVEAGNVIPTSDKLISDIWQDKNGKELGRIYYVKSKSGTTELIMRAGDWFSESEGVYSLNASGTNRRAELHLYTDSSGNCCIKPVGYFSTTLKPLNSSVLLGEYGNSFGSVYAGQFRMSNPSLEPNVDVSANEEHSVGFYGKNNTPLSYITFQKRINLKDRIAVRIQTSASAYKSYCFDATCFYPESSNSLDIGSTTNIFKNIYCNNYYLGTTAFGDIVTHNASEFLTSHQSLANYVTTNTSQSISGIKTFPTPINLATTSTSQIEYWALKFSKTDTNGTGASQIGVYQLANSNDFVATMRLGNPRSDNKPTTGDGVATGNCWAGIGVYYNYELNRGYPYAPNCTSWSDSSNSAYELASTEWVRRYCETTKNFVTNSSLSSASVASASEFSANKDVTLTGDVTGTASSKAGWSVATTLANSGVTAGTYGPSADVTGTNNTTILVPEITVDAKGRVTSVTNRTYTSVNSDSDKKVYQYYKSDDNVYRLLFSNNAGNTATSNVGAVYSGLNNSFYVNPSTGSLYATKLYSNGVEVLTSHPAITLSSNTTSTASPAHGGTFTCIDSVTQDTNGHITKVNTKTVTLPSDNNTDTKVKQYEGTTNQERPILSRYNSTEASQTANFVVYDTGVTSNPAKHTITASGGFIGKLSGVPSGTTNVAGVTNGGALLNAQTTTFGALWRAPTKDYQVACATYPNTNNNVYICYSVTNANVSSGTNTLHKSLYWTADNGVLNTDTYKGNYVDIAGKYLGNESSTNGRSCLYLKANRDTDGKSGLYVTKFRQNVAQGSMGSSDVVFLSHDILENETRTNAGFVESYSNWTNNVPGGMSIYSSIATRNLGTSAKPWTNAYITNLNLNGNTFDPTSTSGNIGDIIFGTCLCTSVSGSGALGITVSGANLYASYIFNGDVIEAYGTPSTVSLTGTWVYLGAGYNSGTGNDKLTGIWKRIA